MSKINHASLAEQIIFKKNFSSAKWAILNLTDKEKKEFCKFCNSEILYEGHPFEEKYGLDIMNQGLEGDSYCMYFLDNQDDFFDFSNYGSLQSLICG